MEQSNLPSRPEILKPLPLHVERLRVSRRMWNGVCVDVNEVWGHGEVCHQLGYENQVRLTGLLEEVGGHCEPRLHEAKRCPIGYTPRHMHFAPAGLSVWGYSPDLRYVKDATLVFDVSTLEGRLGERLSDSLASTPRLRFSDERVWTLLKLLAGAVQERDPSVQLYGDGLTAAVIGALLRPARDAPAAKGGLAAWQLRRVVEYLDAHLERAIPLSTLASLTGLSQAHFARAFKASTGVAPYRWQLEGRIRRAQALLLEARGSLDDVAAATGFSDAAHFGRVFRKLVGVSPAAWRSDRTS